MYATARSSRSHSIPVRWNCPDSRRPLRRPQPRLPGHRHACRFPILEYIAVQSPLGYDYQLAWFDRTGKPDGLLGPARHQVTVSESPRVSPDGRHAAVQRAEAKNIVSGRDLWIGDLARGGTFDRLTTNENFQQLPVWSYDSREIICSTNRQGGVGGIYSVLINGGEKTLLIAGTLFPSDVTPDGKWLIYSQRGETTRNDIWMLPLADGRARRRSSRRRQLAGRRRSRARVAERPLDGVFIGRLRCQ